MMLRRDLIRMGGLGALPLFAGAAAEAAPDTPGSEPAWGGAAPRPEEFGAVGDGKADDTRAVQQAAEAGPGGLHLTAGSTYLIDRLVVPNRSGWVLEGFGATLKKRDDGENYALVVSEKHLRNVAEAQPPIQIRNLRLDGGKVGGECHGIVCQSWNSRLTNLSIHNMTGDGIRVTGVTQNGTPLKSTLVNNWIEGFDIGGCGGHGIHIYDTAGNKCTDWYLGGGWIYGSKGWAIYAREMAGAQVGPRLHTYANKGGGLYANRFSVGSVVQGILFEAGDTCSIVGGWRTGMITHCYFMGDARLEVSFNTGGTCIFKRMVVNGCNFSGKSHILHKGGADRTIEAIGCLFDTPDPFRKERDGAYYATRCWANNQDKLFDGQF